MSFARGVGSSIVHLFEATRDISTGVTGTHLRPRAGVSPKATIAAVVTAMEASKELSAAAEALFGTHVHSVRTVLAAVDDNLSRPTVTQAQTAPPALGMNPIIEAAPMSWWSGVDEVQYLGGSAATGDFNADGFPDVAIGSWGTSATGLPQVCMPVMSASMITYHCWLLHLFFCLCSDA